MKKSLLILLFIIFHSCEKTSSKAEIFKYYPDKDYFKSDNLVQINLDSSDMEFDKILKLVNNIHRKDSLPFFRIKTNNLIRNIGILRNNTSQIKSSSILSVDKDSILIDHGYLIDKLTYLMKRHYENNGKNPHYPINAENAIIKIDLKPNSNIADLKKTLELVTSTFDKLNLKHKNKLILKLILAPDIPSPPTILNPI